MVKLREGRPPAHYYPKELNGNQKKEMYVNGLRRRRIYNAL